MDDSKYVILPVVLGSTVVFEIVGPVLTRRVIKHVKDTEPELISGEHK
jgi:hypothetical protein